MDREKLNLMTVSQLRSLDIKDKADELLVQEILNEKLKDEPFLDPNREILSSSETDNMTPEKEAELQARLDGTPVMEAPFEITKVEIEEIEEEEEPEPAEEIIEEEPLSTKKKTK